MYLMHISWGAFDLVLLWNVVSWIISTFNAEHCMLKNRGSIDVFCKLLNRRSISPFLLMLTGDLCCFCSMFPKATHETFANKLFETFKNHKRFTKPKLSRTDFIISHYAGEVRILYWYFCVILLFVSIQYFIIFILHLLSWSSHTFILILNT